MDLFIYEKKKKKKKKKIGAKYFNMSANKGTPSNADDQLAQIVVLASSSSVSVRRCVLSCV